MSLSVPHLLNLAEDGSLSQLGRAYVNFGRRLTSNATDEVQD